MAYSLSKRRTFESNSDSYAIYLAVNEPKSQLAVNLSNELIEIIDSKTLQTISAVKDLDGLNPIVRYSPQNCNQLIVCTSDSVKIFDLRHKSCKSSKEMNVLSDSNPLSCFDCNSDFTYLCAGTEVSERDRSAYLYFWDVRRPALVLGAYSESHTNDITDVAFHPKRRNVFASGSSDELLNVFDLNEAEEDDAIMATLNVESAVDRIHWMVSADQELVCMTQEESVQLWHWEDDASPKRSLTALASEAPFDYVIDVLDNGLVCVADKSHSIKTFDINCAQSLDDIVFKACMNGGHEKMVRAVAAESDNCVIYSGAEDSSVCVWNRLQTNESSVEKRDTKSKLKSKRSDKKRSNPY